MSTLTELVDIAEETKENSKNALIEKGLELDESFKLSDVDEKIAEIQSGGGTDFTYIKDLNRKGMTFDIPWKNPTIVALRISSEKSKGSYDFTFTVVDYCDLYFLTDEDKNINFKVDETPATATVHLNPGETKTIALEYQSRGFAGIVFGNAEGIYNSELADIIIIGWE